MSKRVKNLVVDTTAFFENAQLQVGSENSLTKYNKLNKFCLIFRKSRKRFTQFRKLLMK